MIRRQDQEGSLESVHPVPEHAAAPHRAGKPGAEAGGTSRTPGRQSTVFLYGTDRYRLVTPGVAEVSKVLEGGAGT
jgi:hypothetical protein